MELGRREKVTRRDRRGAVRTPGVERAAAEVVGTAAVEVGNRKADGSQRAAEVRARAIGAKARAAAALLTSTVTTGVGTLVGAHGKAAPTDLFFMLQE